MKTSIVASLGILIALAAQPIWAQSDRDARFEQQLAATKVRLQLTDDQLNSLRPVLQAAEQAQREVLRRYGIDLDAERGTKPQLGIRDARKLRGDLSKVQQTTIKQLEAILTKRQLDEFRQVQEETRERLKQRIRGGND